MIVKPGNPEPLGVTPDAGGWNVAVFSAHATAIELCLFDARGERELQRISLPERSGDVFHGYFAGADPATPYGLRARGDWDPASGHRFNEAKLLVDPYARALDRPFGWHPALRDHRGDGVTRDLTDSALYVPKALAVPIAIPAQSRTRIPWSQMIVYELHVRGYTRQHPDVPAALRGTCAGLATPAAIDHLVRLGITTVELMPIAAGVDEPMLAQRGLRNYWGYNPVALFAPDPRLAPGGLPELRACVAALHAAGIEVLLDIVLNHTGEGDLEGPTLSLRGLDNRTYYRTRHGEPAVYANDAGCGNTLAAEHPAVLRLATDALRHYVDATGVDGFRLDLAATLGRHGGRFDASAPLFAAIAQDPTLRECKFIAEPWDVGAHGFQLGNFPAPWGEWNSRFRDTTRRFWRGDRGLVADLATRLAGSADVFAQRHRPPSRSVNFVTAHDGFTLADLVSHAHKHNEANGDDNRDGESSNHAWNGGAEGATDDPGILARRARDVRNLLATLLLARGTPMLAMGDELGRTQHGNNNAYAHDSPLTWVDWARADGALADFVGRLAHLRHAYRALHDDRWLTGAAPGSEMPADVVWLRPDGEPMTVADWERDDLHTLLVLLSPRDGRSDADERIVIAFNAASSALDMYPPSARADRHWECVLDTAHEGLPGAGAFGAGGRWRIAPRAVAMLAEVPTPRDSRTGRRASPQRLAELADAAGIDLEWHDIDGRRHGVSPDTQRALLRAMSLPCESDNDVRDGLAHLERDKLTPDRGHLIVAAPAQAYVPPELLAGARRFGISAQLYAQRRDGDQGIGDLTTLAELAVCAGKAGAATLGINPLHALFPGQRDRASPYHPSDRRFIDPIYIDVRAVADFAEAPDAQALLDARAAELATLAAGTLVDYAAAWAIKHAVLRACHARFRRRHPGDPNVVDCARFVAAGGEPLQRFARHEAIAAVSQRGWPAWEASLRDAASPAVARFGEQNPVEVDFWRYLQWLAATQRRLAADAGRAAGLAYGLYGDLAIGAAPDGAETWSDRDAYMRGVSIGAPPDPFAPDGQIWNLAPLDPHALARTDHAAMCTLFAANMRDAGVLRIDHVMGLARQFLVPDGAGAAEGAYLRYPFDGLAAALRQESQRARCMVIGEDLGTVQDELREALARSHVLSYRVLWFERDGAKFRAPRSWPALAAACVSTHDLPPVAAWWSGADIVEQAALGRVSASEAAAGVAQRDRDRVALAQVVAAEGDATLATGEATPDDIVVALHEHAARAPSVLLLVQADDLAGAVTSVNVPGTDRERPNWRYRLPVTVNGLFATAIARRLLPVLRAVRGTSSDA